MTAEIHNLATFVQSALSQMNSVRDRVRK
ncbi:MAG: hypothetical protein QG650_574, partial [Patescibacteria group bacterium]|nr:hypothetical protein [Patescibacteria group bacterium]